MVCRLSLRSVGVRDPDVGPEIAVEVLVVVSDWLPLGRLLPMCKGSPFA